MHEWVLKDGASQNETYKIAVCKKCLYIGKVQPRNEKPKEESVWDVKDRRITRMSVLKVAADCILKASEHTSCNPEDVCSLAEKYENWVYRRVV
jgi:hypothetical protein